MSRASRPATSGRRALTLVAVLGASMLATALPSGAAHAEDGAPSGLYLVTMQGPGTSGTGALLPGDLQAEVMRARQDDVLAEVGAPAPVYRFTTALDGFAVRLEPAQAAAIAARDDVALVEPDSVRRLAAAPRASSTAAALAAAPDAGTGVVVGIVDSGVDPQSPVLAPLAAAASVPGFVGSCEAGPDWSGCTTKVIGAASFVDGFGRDRVRSSASLSPHDDQGHGTLVASIAAGNAGLAVRSGTARLGTFSGVAPGARVAAYKACWTAPEPADDGCSTADLVAAIDRASADGVDVLNLSVGGPGEIDTVERALLGASEAGVVVVTAAGNEADRPAAHPSPWALSVGASTGAQRRADLRLSGGGPTLSGAGSSTEVPGPVRLVPGADAAALGARRADARTCEPGSLDAARVAGRAVLCVRGGGARVAKSLAVQQAGGRAMVLVNADDADADGVFPDFHSVPTIHLDAADGRLLRRWAVEHPLGEVTLEPSQVVERPAVAAAWSSTGGPTGVVKPDLLAPGAGVVGATSTATGRTWDLLAGTSAAAAQVSGAAAALLSRRDLDAATVRSVLTTTAGAAGVLRTDPTLRPGLAVVPEPGSERRWLADPSAVDLNLPTLDVARTATRRITNLGRRTRVFTATTQDFASRVLLVAPAVVRLGPGESTTVTMTADGSGADAGTLTWTGDDGSVARLPVRLR